jgi:3-deoxy-D-manno-octulosonic-acid transferase
MSMLGMSMLEALAFKSYGLFMWAVQPLLRFKLKRRGIKEPGYLLHIEERFGRYHQPQGSGYVWVHAVSLGEARAAGVLLQALRRLNPNMRFVLTHGTATGRAHGQSLLEDSKGDVQVWQPWDTAEAVQKFLRHFQPKLGVLLETEVWPHMAAACKAAGVPLLLVNARMSARSFKQARAWRCLSRPAYAALAGVWAQTQEDALRLTQLGAKVQGVTGNVKFDAQPDAAQLEQGQAFKAQLKRPVVMLASSREGEELEWLQALQKIQGLQWLVVPRHPQRFEAVAELIQSMGWACERRSQSTAGQLWNPIPTETHTPTIWLGDSLGEMSLYYGLASVALLGGSFAPLGGQNLIEAAACACPVVMGPHTFNFKEVAELAVVAGAAQRVSTISEAISQAHQWANQPELLNLLSSKASAFAQGHRGSAEVTAQAIARFWDAV